MKNLYKGNGYTWDEMERVNDLDKIYVVLTENVPDPYEGIFETQHESLEFLKGEGRSKRGNTFANLFSWNGEAYEYAETIGQWRSRIEEMRQAMTDAGILSPEDVAKICDLEYRYADECDAIAEECAAEWYPSCGSNYDLRCESRREFYDEQIDSIMSKYPDPNIDK